MKPRALASELVGAFALTSAVFISINNPGFPIPTPAIAGLTLGLFVYMIGPVSGCHINPAVTIGLLSIGKIGLKQAAGYVIAQFAGAGLALALGNAFFADPADLMASGSALTGFAEMFGAALPAFSVTTVVIGRVSGHLSGAVIGTGLMVGISFAAHGSNGVLNPAVAFGIGSLSLSYAWGPVDGAVVGAMLARYLSRTRTPSPSSAG